MKVVKLETRPIEVALQEPIISALGPISSCGVVVVRLHTSDGVVGENLVFTLNNRRTAVLRQMVDELADLVVGQDAGHIGAFWARAWKDMNFFGQKGIPVMGISAIDGALWDAAAKSAGLPLYRMLGGAQDRVPAYHSGGLWLHRSIDELARDAQNMVEQGFHAVKMRLGSADPVVDIQRVRAVREAIGPNINLMADANQGLNEAQAIRLGRMLEEYQLAWFEEPLPAWDLEGVARVAAALDTPIASGETEYARYGFRRMIELRSADVLMPDLQRSGGVSEFVRIANMAAAYDIPVSSHLFPEMSLQVLGALSNATYLEYMPWFSDLYQERLEFEDGKAIVPQRPGWGFTFDLDRIAHLEANRR
jgi:L-alanine-DL-glutamate epimerase-like enolase superfamily enzyme